MTQTDHDRTSETASSTPEDEQQPSHTVQQVQNYWDYCPNCGTHLQNRGCKYRCPKCHYFMSCSDFD